MELRQLEYFQMASRLKNITRAARKLRVSQPNITVAIKKLEAELGVQLFDRSQKQLTLTPEGRVFLKRIEVALRNIDDAILEVIFRVPTPSPKARRDSLIRGIDYHSRKARK